MVGFACNFTGLATRLLGGTYGAHFPMRLFYKQETPMGSFFDHDQKVL